MSSFAQEGIGELIQTARHLGSSGFHQQAITEYQRVVYFGKDSSFLYQAYYGMAIEYRESADREKAEGAFQRAILLASTDSIRDEARVALAANYASAGSPGLCMLTLLPLARSSTVPHVRRQAALMLLLCAVIEKDWNEGIAIVEECSTGSNASLLDDSSRILLIKELKEASTLEMYSPGKAELFSTILPGSGQMYSGDFRNGVNALALNSINGWIVINSIVHGDYAGAILYAGLVAERYYSGNRYHASESALLGNENLEKQAQGRILSTISQVFLVPAPSVVNSSN